MCRLVAHARHAEVDAPGCRGRERSMDREVKSGELEEDLGVVEVRRWLLTVENDLLVWV